MPELPEVETVRRGLTPVMQGAIITKVDQNRPNLRFPFSPDFTRILKGCKIVDLKRRAKYLIFHLDNDYAIISHLGMSGSFRIIDDGEERPGGLAYPKSKKTKHDHVVFHLDTCGQFKRVIYNDPRRFGFMLLVKCHEIDHHPSLKELGPEPTGNGIDTQYLAGKFLNKNTVVKSLLLDQKIIAGLGNIYVCEALWRTRLSPLRKAKTLVNKQGHPKEDLSALSYHIQNTITEAISAGGSSLNDHIQTDGNSGYFQHNFAVYGQEGKSCCHPDCKGVIKRIMQNGRSTFYCPECQT